MIEFFKSWCEGIIVAVVISIIIESILPEGNNKKYVKVVIGVYIIFTILSPFFEKLNMNFDFSNPINLEKYQVSTSVNSDNIKNLYTNGIEVSLKSEIEDKFNCKVNNLKMEYDEKYENIEKVIFSMQNSNIEPVEKVEIGNKKEIEENNNYEEIKNYIEENYNIDKSKIIIN